MVLPLQSCSATENRLTIKSELIEYSPYMSSTPGIPLIAVFNRELSNKNYIYHWIAEEGTFLKWQNSTIGMGRIEVLGSDVMMNEHKIIWTVDPDHDIKTESFELHLTIEELDTGNVMFETSLEIIQKEPLFFVIKNED